MDDLIADILADPLAQLSVTFAQPDQASPDPDQSVATRRFTLTPTGRWLLQPTVAALPDGLESWPNTDSPGQATLMPFVEEETEGWLLSLDTTVAPHRLLPLAPFVEHLALDRSGPVTLHRLKLGPVRLAQAAAQGHELAALLRALDGLGIDLSSTHLAQLAVWHDQGRQLALSLLPVLRIRQTRTFASGAGPCRSRQGDPGSADPHLGRAGSALAPGFGATGSSRFLCPKQPCRPVSTIEHRGHAGAWAEHRGRYRHDLADRPGLRLVGPPPSLAHASLPPPGRPLCPASPHPTGRVDRAVGPHPGGIWAGC